MKVQKIVAMLPITDFNRSIDYYQRALGFEVVRQSAEWGWAFLSRDGCGLMLDRSIHSGRGSDAVTYIYTDNLDEYYQQVTTAGIDAEAPAVTFYGMREFRLTDPDGNELWVGNLP